MPKGSFPYAEREYSLRQKEYTLLPKGKYIFSINDSICLAQMILYFQRNERYIIRQFWESFRGGSYSLAYCFGQ